MKLAAIALCLSVSLSSCFSLFLEPPALAPRECRALMRVDEASGALEWLSIDRGVGVKGSKGVAHLRAVLAGARSYPIEGGFISWDLDQLGEAETSDYWMFRVAPDISVVGVGLAEAGDGSLTVWRHTRVARAAHWLYVLQRDEGSEDRVQLGQFPTIDAASLELQRAAHSAGAANWRIEGRTFVFEVPSTLDNALRCQEEILCPAQPPNIRFPLELCRFFYKDGLFTVRYMVGDADWVPAWTMSTRGVEGVEEPQGVSVDELREAGLPIETQAQLSARLVQLGVVE